MIELVKSIGHGLLAAGAFLIAVYFIGLYVKGSDTLRDALDPLSSKNYLVLLALVPGAFVLWLGDYVAAWRRRLLSAVPSTTAGANLSDLKAAPFMREVFQQEQPAPTCTPIPSRCSRSSYSRKKTRCSAPSGMDCALRR